MISKRDLLAAGCSYTGMTRLAGLLPTKTQLLVLNYHRIGNADETPYDSGVFSATGDEFDDHVRYLKRRFHVATLDEAIDLVEGTGRPPSRTVVLLTFDDGYLDNYRTAFPILASHGVQGVFFLPTSFVGERRLPWWDTIAWIVKHSRKRAFRLGSPASPEFDIARDGARRVVEQLLWHFKTNAAGGSEPFLAALEEACEVPRPDGSERLFLDWGEAEEMVRGGMAVGGHTHSHEILSSLSPEQQLEELTLSKRILEERLRVPVSAMSYPVGLQHSFTEATREAAAAAQYRVAFSFYGGFNPFGATERYDVRRFTVAGPAPRFRLQTTLGAVTGKYWF